MGREVKRVPLDFAWPLRKVWEGFIMPDRLSGDKCPDCENGYSRRGQYLHDLWYGKVPFDPASTGSERLTASTPAVRAFAERNVDRDAWFYGSGEQAVVREATRLAGLWNGCWSHHLAQEDVDALVDAGRLRDLTHTWTKGEGWQPKDPPVRPTAAEVNEWSISGGFGHDSINCGIVVSARCEREGVSDSCATCQGHAYVESYPGQRAEAEAWERTEPPEGDGYQLWETVSEGSPVSPVFATAEELAAWMTDPLSDAREFDRASSFEAAMKFIDAGWAPSFISGPGIGFQHGVEAVGGSL